MKSQKYSLFRKVSDDLLLVKLEGFLYQHDIEFKSEEKDGVTCLSIANYQSEELEDLMIENNEIFTEGDPDDIYLRGFSDKELLEIITAPQEWSAIDFHLAVKLLVERGIHIKSAVAV